MARRILSCRGNASPGQPQPQTPKDEPDIQPASSVYQIPYRPVSDPPREPPPPSPPAGIKRERSGQPRTPARNQRFHSSDWSSSDELDSSSSSSDSDSDASSCAEGKHGWRVAVPAYVLPQDHRFQDIRPELVQSILASLERWMETTRYVSPPDDRLPPRKRLRTSSHWQEGEDSDDGFVVVDPQTGYLHLACPFHVANPAKYQDCLLHHDLQSNQDVIRHIWRDHMKPPYCPICSRTFDSLSSRDSHILERKCELRDLQPIDGINFYQRSRLKRRDRVYLGEARRWRRIYATVFPNSNSCPSPYLDRGCGKAVSMARDYWAARGRRSVSRFLESRKLLNGDEDEDAQDALCKLVLEDVLREMVGRYGRS